MYHCGASSTEQPGPVHDVGDGVGGEGQREHRQRLARVAERGNVATAKKASAERDLDGQVGPRRG